MFRHTAYRRLKDAISPMCFLHLLGRSSSLAMARLLRESGHPVGCQKARGALTAAYQTLAAGATARLSWLGEPGAVLGLGAVAPQLRVG